MSSISAVGQGLNPFLQGITATPWSQPVAASSPTTTGDPTDPTQQVQGGGGHHHHGDGGKFFQAIQSAVTSALQSAQSNGNDTDPNQVIQSAIAQALQSFQSGASGSAAQTGNAAEGTTATTTDDDSTTGSTFAQLLESNGVDAQQFHEDFLSAINSAQNGGSADASGIFSNFPPGSVVDTLA